MPRAPRRGLALGKFAPLHAGHQLMIETALREVDELIVIIYDSPAVTDAPLPVRSGWLRRLYPQVRVIEAWDGPEETGDTPEIKARHERYVIDRLGVAGITHFYSSEFYGEHMSRALGAVNRQIDPDRRLAPVSGTAIRESPFAQRAYVHPLVYRDLITNAVFVGAPSTGKTTIARHMAQLTGTQWMPEYGREYWEAHQQDRRLSPTQLVAIAEGHLEREDALLAQSDRYLFTDTNAATTFLFALAYHGAAEPRLAELADRCWARYDLVFLCGDEIPYDDSWDRSGEADRAVFQKRVAADLRARKIPWFDLRGGLEERAATVSRVLGRHRKYGNLLELSEER